MIISYLKHVTRNISNTQKEIKYIMNWMPHVPTASGTTSLVWTFLEYRYLGHTKLSQA